MAAGKESNWGTLVPRFLLGTVFVFHGGRMLFGLFGAPADLFPRFSADVASWGWPQPDLVARAFAATKFFGGACLLLGLLTRFWAAALTAVCCVLAWKVHRAAGFAAADGGWEYPFVLGVLALSLVVQGGGAFALDGFVGKAKPKPQAQPGRG